MFRLASFDIAGRWIGSDQPPYIIAEVGQAHDGSLGTAHAYVDAAAEAGVDAVKFQTHIAAAESTRDEPFRVPFSYEDESRFDYWARMEFSLSQWRGLADHASARGMAFLSSAFSHAAVELLKDVDVPAWKVGSGEARSQELLNAMAATGKPILLSTGMSTYQEIQSSFSRCRQNGSPVALFQCTSKYPVAMEDVGLNVLDELRERFPCQVGLSDHSGTLWPSVAAMALGASLVEVHVVFHRAVFGPDVSSSITVDQLKELVAARDAIAAMRNHPVHKDVQVSAMEEVRSIFTKSLALVEDLPTGTVITREMLTMKKPGTGIPEASLDRVIGRRLVRPVTSDRLLRWEDLDA